MERTDQLHSDLSCTVRGVHGEHNQLSLGDRIRDSRLAHKRGLRDLARELGLAPSYLSDIENDRRVPAEPVLQALSDTLDLDFNELMWLGGRLGDEAETYARQVPPVARLFRRVAKEKLNEEQVAKLDLEIDKITGAS